MDLQSNFLQGTCTEMCPEDEIGLREKEKLLHLLEMVPGTERKKYPTADRNRTVKAFSRSAAGKEIQAKDLRPPDVLLKTVGYLLFDVIDAPHLPWNIVYDFITDRLMAVRQDMVVQNVSKAETIVLLQPIIRFHAYSAYRMCNENLQKFDKTLNNKHLQECLKKLLTLYDEDYYMESRLEFEAIYLIFNLGNTEALNRFITLPKAYRKESVIISFVLSLSYKNGNYVRVCRLMKSLPPLLAALASLHLSAIRKKALQTMSIAYNSRNLTFPTKKLKDLLLYSSAEELLRDCKAYGIYCGDACIVFSKNSFNCNATTVAPRYELFVEEMLLGKSIQSLLLPND